MRWFQLGKKPGRKPLRLLILAGILTLVLSGCGTSKYETVDLSVPGTSGTVAAQNSDSSGNAETAEQSSLYAEKPAIVLGESGAGRNERAGSEAVLSGESGNNRTADGDGLESSGGDSEAADRQGNAEEPLAYQDTDDYIVVTADILNVREADNTDARIYIQLPTGEILHRTGYNDEWCRVDYDGGVAYVSADMVEITEPPAIEETVSADETLQTENVDGTAQAGGDAPLEVSEAAIPMYQKTGIVQEEITAVPFNGHVVAIDAGHQAKANAEKEPIGPASQTKKAKMPEGAVGTVTGVKEYELTLTVAKKLETELKTRGYEVVMVRESHDVNLSNAERSEIANDSDAEIFIRLHANSMENSGIYGAMTMCMTEYNPYNSELSDESYRLSKQIVNNICANTGTKNRGVQKVDNSSAINWCEIPVSVVEMGFLTNPDEDRWLQTEEYQGKIVEGISDAIDTYFADGNGE